MVDVISSNGWLNSAMETMELTQMFTQGLWEHDFFLTKMGERS